MINGLEALERIVGCSTIESHRPKWQEDYKIIEKSLKALEIIKNKPWLVSEIVESKGNYKVYKSWCSVFRADMKYRATEEEYELLKEVLG